MVKETRYYEQAKANGKCSVCGKTGVDYSKKIEKGKHKGKQFPKAQYFKVFDKVNWFRGDDEYAGIICKDCIKAGRLEEAHKQIPQQALNEKDTK